MRAEHRSADADVEDPGNAAKRAGFDRVDQRAGPLPACCGEVDILRRPTAAFGDMGCGTALAGIDDVAREQGIASGGKAGRVGARDGLRQQLLVEMGLRPVEIDAASLETEAAQSIGLGLEQRLQRPDPILLPFDCHCRRHIMAGRAKARLAG